MKKIRGIIISIITVLLMAGCICSSALAEDSSPAPNNWGGDMMGLTQAKASVDALINDGVKLPEIKVAVIDTGANANHDLLKGRILPSSKSFINSDTSDYSDQNGHGTHVAGIIVQNTPSNVKILVLQALDENKKGEAENIAQAINYAVSQGADIINLSLGMSRATGAQTGENDAADGTEEVADDDEYRAYVATISEAITQAKSAGCLIIAAAGNSEGGRDLAESQTYPAISDDVITVSAISEDKSFYENSNYGEAVDFCAPGEDIYSAGITSNTALEHLSGTSMATPFISSAFAMLKLYNPEVSTSDLVNKLQSRDVTQDVGVAGKDPQYGYGLPMFVDGVVPNTKLPKPEIKKTTSDGETITLEWDVVSYLTYDVYRRESGTEEFSCIASDLSEGQFVDEEVVLGATYEYYLETLGGKLYLIDIKSEIVEQEAEIAITSLSFYSFNRIIAVSDSVKINYSFKPENATHQEFIWKSSNEEVCIVDQFGVVTGLKQGRADIYLSQKGHEEIYTSSAVYVVDSSIGKCGDNVNWYITEDNDKITLIISGSGDMYNYGDNENSPPWRPQASTIEKIIIEDGVTNIGQEAFRQFVNLTEVIGMHDVKMIGVNAFSQSGLQNIALPKGIEQIGSSAFSSCYGLKNVSLEEGLLKIGDYAFRSCSQLKQLVLPEGLLEIGEGAFRDTGITSVLLPDSLRAIGRSAFSDTHLSEISIPKEVTQIGGGAFQTKSMTGIEVSEENQCYCSIDGVLFDKSIETIISFPGAKEGVYTFPETVQSIDDYAFESCLISEIYVSQDVSTIPEGAFIRCKASKIVLPSGLKTIGSHAFYKCGPIEVLELPNGLETIETQALFQANIKKIIIPGSIEEIRSNVFSNTSSLEEVVIGEGITDIYSNAFYNCLNLHSITLPSTIKKMRNRGYEHYEVFRDCASIEDIYYCGFTKEYKSIENIEKETNLVKDDVTLHIQASGTAGNGITWKAEGISGDITLTISGNEAIPDYTDPNDAPWYDGKDEITHVVIEDGITKVGKNSFFRYEKIEDVTLPESVQDIGRDAFRACNALEAALYTPEDAAVVYRIEPQYLVSLYSGSEITPGVYVSLSGVDLQEETDYQVSYKNNIKIGTAIIEVSFIGNHAGKGSVRIPFTITDKLMDGENIKALSSITLAAGSYEYNGSAHKPAAVVKSGRWVLKENADYKLDYSTGRKDIGTYKVVASGVGAYTGTKWDSFEITPKSIAGFSASLSTTSYTYDGKAKTPTVSVSGLTANDYSVSYSDNTEVGTGKVTVTGKGNYTGQKEMAFTIKEAPKTDPESSSSDDNNSKSNNSGSSNSGSKSSGKSSNTSGANSSARSASSRSSAGSNTSGRIASSSSSSRTGTSTGSGTAFTRNRTLSNAASRQSERNSSDKKDQDAIDNKNDKTAEEDNGLAKDKELVHDSSIEQVPVLPTAVKYIVAGLFLAVAAAGIFILILMIKKKKKKAA